MFETLIILKQGGWTMIPLALCSVVAATIIIERAIALRRAIVIDNVVVRAIEEYTGEDSVGKALEACEMSGSPLGRVVEEVLHMRHLEMTRLREAMYASGRVQVGRLERGLTLLEIIAGVSPLLGLLGTVLGMLTVFNTVTAHGIGDPQVLSSGIAKALVTTIAGLCVAIPALACHSWFSKRVDDLASEIQGYATRLMTRLQGMGTTVSPPSNTEEHDLR